VANDGASQRLIADEQGLLERLGQRDMQHHEEVRKEARSSPEQPSVATRPEAAGDGCLAC
jgi:hypothetical protein